MASPVEHNRGAREDSRAPCEPDTTLLPPAGVSAEVDVIEGPPVKQRRVWPVGKEGTRVDALCLSVVTMFGVHLDEWGKGDKLHQKAASMVTEQPGRPFAVDWRATKKSLQGAENKGCTEGFGRR